MGWVRRDPSLTAFSWREGNGTELRLGSWKQEEGSLLSPGQVQVDGDTRFGLLHRWLWGLGLAAYELQMPARLRWAGEAHSAVSLETWSSGDLVQL